MAKLIYPLSQLFDGGVGTFVSPAILSSLGKWGFKVHGRPISDKIGPAICLNFVGTPVLKSGHSAGSIRTFQG
jgi:hypothetical protein